MSERHRPMPIRSNEDRREIAKLVLMAPRGSVVVIRPEKRREEQSRLWHALLDELETALVVKGRRYSHDEWADIMVGDVWGWRDVVDPLTGEVRCVRRSTKELSVAEMSDLIEATYANGAALGHVWKAHRPGEEAA